MEPMASTQSKNMSCAQPITFEFAVRATGACPVTGAQSSQYRTMRSVSIHFVVNVEL